MRKSVLIFGAFGLIILVQEAAATLMLGSLLMALKGGMFAGKMGLGGLLAMALAGTQNQEGIATGAVYSRKRATRSVTSVSETPLDLKEPPNGTHLSAENLANSLNNITLPSTRRMMRQVAILDQLSCLPKVLCGLNTRTPSSKTSVINDYGYLIKFLFERDSDDADQEDEEQDDDDERDDERDDDDDDDEALSRAEASVTKKTKKKANKEGKPQEDDYDSKEDDLTVDDEEFDKLSPDDDQLEEQAQDELLQNEPEMLSYILTEMRHKMKGQGRKGGLEPTPPRQYAIGSPYHKGGYPTYQPDHSYLPGYNKASYMKHPDIRPALNTDSASAILNEPSAYTRLKGNGFKYGSPKFEFKIGANDNEGSKGGFLSSLLPSFSFSSVKTKGSTSADQNDPFANDPFFSGFKRRSLTFPTEARETKTTSSKPVSGRALSAPRINSKFKHVDTTYVDLKREQIANSQDPAQKYKIAAEVGQKTKSARQCRMLFAKCPYEYTEIMTMIENVKKLLNTQSQVGDKEVTLKKAVTAAPSISSSSDVKTPVVSTHSGGSTGNVINLAPGVNSGVTSISHQLDSGDKVEIMLKFQPKDEQQTKPIFQIIPATFEKSPTSDLINATQSLLEMKKAIQAIQAINRLYNRTDLQFVGLQNHVSKTESPVVSTHRPETTTSISDRIVSLKGTVPKDSTTTDKNKPIADAHSESVESDSTSKSSEEVIVKKRRNGITTPVEKKPVEEDDDSSSREDEEEDDDDDDDEDEDDEEVVADDPAAAARAQATFQSLAKPPQSGPVSAYQGHMYRNDQPIITSFHFEGLEAPKIPPTPQSRGRKRPAPLPPKPSPYKIIRSKPKQRPRTRTEDTASTKKQAQNLTSTTKMPQHDTSAKTTQPQADSTAQTKPPRTRTTTNASDPK